MRILLRKTHKQHLIFAHGIRFFLCFKLVWLKLSWPCVGSWLRDCLPLLQEALNESSNKCPWRYNGEHMLIKKTQKKAIQSGHCLFNLLILVLPHTQITVDSQLARLLPVRRSPTLPLQNAVYYSCLSSHHVFCLLPVSWMDWQQFRAAT